MSGLLIAGAGAAGLSLAVHLVRAGETRPITIFEPREALASPRTFCFFRTQRHPFEAEISHRWPRVRVASGARDVICEAGEHPYEHLPGDAFFAACERVLRAAGVTIRLGCAVREIVDEGDHVRFDTTHGTFAGALAFDARPPRTARGASHVHLLQHFRGHVVRTADDAFEPGVATLMDFRVSQARGIHFVYVLPFSPREALVEDTYFGDAPLDRDAYEREIARYVARPFEIVRSEEGAIPMTTQPFPARLSPRVVRLGIGGGLARPSTGYAFMGIQRFSEELAARVVGTCGPIEPPRPYSRRAEALDRVFLSFLARHPARGPALFVRMFERLPFDVVVRFLTDQSSPLDEVRVMRALSSVRLAAESVRSYRRWLLPQLH